MNKLFGSITSCVISWNDIFRLSANAAGVVPDIIHIPSDVIAKYDSEWGAELFGDKAHSVIFDNAKIKRLVPDFSASIPFSRGVEEIITWHDADPARQVIDEQLDRLMDRIAADYEAAFDQVMQKEAANQ